MKKLAFIIFIFSLPLTGNNFFISLNEKIEINEMQEECFFDGGNIKLIYPRSAFPVIVDKGGNFTAIINFSYFDEIEAFITTAYNQIPDKYKLYVDNIWQDDLCHINLRLPQNVVYELYNLTIMIFYENKIYKAVEPRAVSVQKIDGNFSFIHLSDLHIGDLRGLKENIKETIGWKAVKKCIEEINLIKPNFVVITGDLVFGQLYPFEYRKEYKKCYEILQLFKVPTYLCPGNHDGYIKLKEDGLKFWQEYFCPLYYSFNYGKSHFVMVNSYDWPKRSRIAFSCVVFNWGGYIGKEQLRWIEADLEKEKNAKLKFILLHHNPLWDTKNDSLFKNPYEGREEILFLIEKYNVDAVLCGHVHYDNVTIRNGTLFITTTTPSSSLGKDTAYWGYRLIEIKNWSIYSYSYKGEGSIPSYRLNYSFEKEYKAIIKNDLDINIKAHLSFIVPLGEYEVKNGKIENIRYGEKLMEIYVTSEIGKRTEKEIYLYLL